MREAKNKDKQSNMTKINAKEERNNRRLARERSKEDMESRAIQEQADEILARKISQQEMFDSAVPRRPRSVPTSTEGTGTPTCQQMSEGIGRPLSGELPKPKAKDTNKRDMTNSEMAKLGVMLQNLPQDKQDEALQIIRKRHPDLVQEGDEIELDFEAMHIETLWELDRFFGNYRPESLIPTTSSNGQGTATHQQDKHMNMTKIKAIEERNNRRLARESSKNATCQQVASSSKFHRVPGHYVEDEHSGLVEVLGHLMDSGLKDSMMQKLDLLLVKQGRDLKKLLGSPHVDMMGILDTFQAQQKELRNSMMQESEVVAEKQRVQLKKLLDSSFPKTK